MDINLLKASCRRGATFYDGSLIFPYHQKRYRKFFGHNSDIEENLITFCKINRDASENNSESRSVCEISTTNIIVEFKIEILN